MNGSVEPSRGVMRAAAMVPMPLTAISSCSGHPIGPTCLNHSMSTRSERRTTIGQRSYSALQRPRHQSEFHEWESHASRGPMSRGLAPSVGGSVASRSFITSSDGGEASCKRATSASICSSSPPRLMFLGDVPTNHCYGQFILRWSVRNPTTYPVWSTPHRKSHTATGRARRTGRRQCRNGLTVSSPRGSC